MRLLALGQVEDHGLHALVDLRLPRDPELHEDRVDHLLDRALGDEQRLRDRGVVLTLGHLAEDITLAGRELVERGRLGSDAVGHQRVDDLRIDHRAAFCDGSDRPDELLDTLVVGVVNMPEKNIAGFRSQALILGVPAADGGLALLRPSRDAQVGGRVY